MKYALLVLVVLSAVGGMARYAYSSPGTGLWLWRHDCISYFENRTLYYNCAGSSRRAGSGINPEIRQIWRVEGEYLVSDGFTVHKPAK